MTKRKDVWNQQVRKWRLTRALLMLAVGVLVVAAGVTVRSAAARRGNDHDQEGKKGFQDKGDRSRFRNDDDWDNQDRDHRREAYAIGLWGDMPYSEVQAAAVLNLIDDMNSQKLAFTVHDGDLKAGKGTPGVILSTCDNSLYTRAIGFFNSLREPAAFTPGDNDWTDCDIASNGNFNSLERLDYERANIFNTPYTLGMRQLRQALQTDAICLGYDGSLGLDPSTSKPDKLVPCVENRRWTYRGVTYATLNIQGSCDNRCKDHPNTHEADIRQAAVIAWMKETFQVAKDRDSAAIMFISQADPSFNDHPVESEPPRNPKTLDLITPLPAGVVEAHKGYLVALRDAVKDFRKPVVWVHGDTHYFHIDKPLYDSDPTAAVSATARRLENFTRVETFGDNVFTDSSNNPLPNANPDDKNNVHWVKVFVDPDSREVFSFQPQIVPSNRPVVPAP